MIERTPIGAVLCQPLMEEVRVGSQHLGVEMELFSVPPSVYAPHPGNAWRRWSGGPGPGVVGFSYSVGIAPLSFPLWGRNMG